MERREKSRKDGSSANYEEQKMRRRNVQEAKYNMYMNKRKGVQSVREQLRDDLARKDQFH
jgi:DNA anti-recombination protein RmuC